MKYKAVVEIPKGCDKRIHLSYDGISFIDLGLIKEEIPINEGVMPICYGYIENIINEIEKDNLDVIIFSNKPYKTKDKIDIDIIGMINREDGDHKVIAVDNSVSIKDFDDIDQEERNLILEYFGYKSKITSIDNRDKTLEYIQSSIIQKNAKEGV
jgi:inorganic pyrophosphatase